MPPMRPPIACKPPHTRIFQIVGKVINRLPIIRPAVNAHIVENESKIKVLETNLSKELPYPVTLIIISKRMLATTNPII